MTKTEYLKIVDSLNLPKDEYCIIAGGIYLMYGLKEETDDIDLAVKTTLFNKLKEKYTLLPSLKMPNLYELGSNVELKVQDFTPQDVSTIDDYPVYSLEKQLEWMLENNRPKDQEKIKLTQAYLRKEK